MSEISNFCSGEVRYAEEGLGEKGGGEGKGRKGRRGRNGEGRRVKGWVKGRENDEVEGERWV